MTFSDFGGFPPGAAHSTHRIEGLDHLRDVVGACIEQHRRLRARGFAHSMNGMSVPRADEDLLEMTSVRHIRWLGDGVVAAGAGLSVWELDRYVRRYGWKLPVINDGNAEAPSVGGFVAAGGIGEGGVFHGGFWESVRALTIVFGTGQSRCVARDDPLFPWMFGTMGGLGIVYEAQIDLVPAGPDAARAIDACPHLPPLPPAAWPRHLWLTLFVPEGRREEGIEALQALTRAHPDAWTPHAPYEYFLAWRRFNPPFLFDGDASFVALGVWGDIAARTDGLRAYFAMESDFQQLVEASGFRRYFQSELIRSRRELERYVGADCAARYRSIKASCDPHGLLNDFMPERDPAG